MSTGPELWFGDGARGTVEDGRPVLFCLPHAGGGASAFGGWAQALAPDIEALPVALPGRERRIAEAARIEPPVIAAAIAVALRARGLPRYAFYGHSLGGWLAVEVIDELGALGVPSPVRLYVGAARPPDLGLSPELHGLSQASDDTIARRLTKLGGFQPEIFDYQELADLVMRVIRADFDWLERYVCRERPPLAVPIVAFAGTDDHVATAADMAGWARYTAGGLTIRQVPGGHLFAQERRAELTGFIKADLSSGGQLQSTRAQTTRARTPEHCVPLGSTGWDVWQEAVLRMAGFPADGLTTFASPESALAADAYLDGERESVEAVLTGQWRLGVERAAQIAADPAFVEAVTWQNRSVLVTLEGLARPSTSWSKTRMRARTVARYWQRYCGKNETIGFFGPSTWVKLDPGSAPVTLTHAAGLRDRRVYLEHWAIQAVADQLAADQAIRRWLPAALAPHLTLDGDRLLRPAKPPVPLRPDEVCALRLCDGRSAEAVVADLVPGTVRTAADGYLLLDRLAERGFVLWGACLPQHPDAEYLLREQVAAIGDEPARARATASLDALARAREEVAAAAGDPAALRTALDALDATFTAITGSAPRRRAGQMYAGRNLCYEDAGAGVDVVIGGAVLDALAGPLGVLLPAARWLTAALAEAYDRALRELFDDVADASGRARLSDLWYLAQGLLFGSGERPVDRVAENFVARWGRLFRLDQSREGSARLCFASADLAGPAALAFPSERPGFAAARLHSPDIHICADDEAALGRGEFYLVLGEMHAAWATFDTAVFTTAHPEPSRLRDALAADVGEHRIRPLYPADWPRYTGRIAHTLDHPTDRQLGFTAAPGADPRRLLPVTAVTVSERDGGLMASAPDGRSWPLIEFFAPLISMHAVDAFKLVTAAPHTPRITVDRMVVVRETWRTTVAQTGLVEAKGEPATYLAGRRLRRALGLPERVFVKLGTETKPVYADLTSPLYVNSLCAMLRRAHEEGGDDVPVTFTELLPGPEHAWLTDAAGRRYFSELRLQVRDPRSGAVR